MKLPTISLNKELKPPSNTMTFPTKQALLLIISTTMQSIPTFQTFLLMVSQTKQAFLLMISPTKQARATVQLLKYQTEEDIIEDEDKEKKGFKNIESDHLCKSMYIVLPPHVYQSRISPVW